MITVLIIIFTSITTAISLHIFARYRDWLSERNNAALKFRSVFSVELSALNPYDKSQLEIVNVLENRFSLQEVAFQEFKLFLTKTERDRIDYLWREYCHCNNGPYPYLYQYDNKSGSVEQNKKNSELALKRIEILVSCANPKTHWLPELIDKIQCQR